MKKETYLKLLIIIGILAIVFNLQPPQIKAAVLEPWATSENRIRWDQQGTDTYSSWNSTPYTYTPSYPVDKVQFRLKATDGLSYENTYILQFGYKPTPQSITPIKVNIFTNINSVVYQEIVCSEFQYNTNGYNLVKCSFTPNEDISSSTWLYVEINLTSGYVTDIRPYMYGFEERKGTNAVITDTGNQIIINIEDQTEQIENAISNSTNDLKDAISNSNKACKIIGKDEVELQQKYLNQDGSLGITGNNEIGVSKYINLDLGTIEIYKKTTWQYDAYMCYYDINKTLISCEKENNKTTMTIPNNASYFRYTILPQNTPLFKYCQNGNQAIIDADHNYNGADIGTQVDEYEQQEEEIETITNVDLTDRLTLNWNTSTLNWIWTTFDTIRGSYLKVFALMTSFLALGIIRLVLGR